MNAQPAKYIFASFAATILVSLLMSCAQVRGVSGGEKDVTPPVAVDIQPPPMSVRFTGQSVSFTFDEFVQVNNLAQNLIISPPLKKMPRYAIRGKTIIFTFQEELLGETTYVMQFGDAISDVHESNVLRGFSYVFSTGGQLDSLWVNGSVVNPWDGTPEKGARILLFHPDSIALTGKKPLYYGISDENGNFSLPYLREGSYSLYALADESPNFIADEGERVGFNSGLVLAGRDTSAYPPIPMSAPRQKVPLSIDYMADSTGLVTLKWPRYIGRPTLKSLLTGDTLFTTREFGRDSVQAWIQSAPVSDWHPIQVLHDGNVLDTIDVQHFPIADLFQDLKAMRALVYPGDSQVITSRDAITRADPEAVSLMADSTTYAVSAWKVTGANQIAIKSNLPAGLKAEVIFPPGSINGPQGANRDSVRVAFQTGDPKDLGTLVVSLPDTPLNNPMVLLSNESGDTGKLLSVSMGTSLEFRGLRPGSYTLRLFDDTDGDGHWTPCDPATRSQPEFLLTYPQKINVRSNWQVQIDW